MSARNIGMGMDFSDLPCLPSMFGPNLFASEAGAWAWEQLVKHFHLRHPATAYNISMHRDNQYCGTESYGARIMRYSPVIWQIKLDAFVVAEFDDNLLQHILKTADMNEQCKCIVDCKCKPAKAPKKTAAELNLEKLAKLRVLQEEIKAAHAELAQLKTNFSGNYIAFGAYYGVRVKDKESEAAIAKCFAEIIRLKENHLKELQQKLNRIMNKISIK